jgi:hypothetical protein
VRAGVRDFIASNSTMTASESGWLAQERKFARLLSLSHGSAAPADWEKSMYQDFSRCSSIRRNVEGWPTDSTAR